ncbi:anti-anti-sigma factor [Virgibacillus indicus]|uniref:Anti-anti-sigma factor n=1 Tax=Virgibacillus indicus TaxID=2024554 RepID=A0A265NER6_9BACI|nr:STAS domain-containing protein [Virgibacillus indicus]OZU90285.1 anti-anti-sigma factor [Virgibacillus indicus]
MEFIFNQDLDIKGFLKNNSDLFEAKLLSEAVHVRDKIEEIKLIGNINLIENAHKLILLVIDSKKKELSDFAKQEGELWAKYSLTLSFKLEWVQAIRKTLWTFIHEYDKRKGETLDMEDFYTKEFRINYLMDEFFKDFFITYSKYKDELIESQKQLVENLSVPIIPISSTVSILPLIGTIDNARARIIEEKILYEISEKRVQTLIMDLSGIAEMDVEVIQNFLKVLDGVAMMGCRTIVTGLRPDIVRNITALDISFDEKVKTKATLKQALKGYIKDEDTDRKNISLFS